MAGEPSRFGAKQSAQVPAAPKIAAAVESRLSETLGAGDAGLPAGGRVDLPRLRLRLPHGSGPEAIAKALSRAVQRAVRGRRP